jgi:hypothetical protein
LLDSQIPSSVQYRSAEREESSNEQVGLISEIRFQTELTHGYR